MDTSGNLDCDVRTASVGRAADPVEGNEIEVWTGPLGPAASFPTVRAPRHLVRLSSLPTTSVERQDVQYGRTLRFQGIALDAFLSAARPPPSADLAVLHFVNGMTIPIPFRAPGTLSRLNAFIARAVWTQWSDGQLDWDFSLPNVEKQNMGLTDVRPIIFHGNKVVVATRWHPAVPTEQAEFFSPWLYADTLVGVEWAEAKAYRASLPEGTTDESRHGRELFSQRCQFCHGVRGVGASFGWDFVEPLPLFTYRGPDSLYLHVKYRDGNAAAKGLLMPAFPDVTPGDAEALWEWMRDAATR